jgi:RNA polymerase-binding transcription factor DksA
MTKKKTPAKKNITSLKKAPQRPSTSSSKSRTKAVKKTLVKKATVKQQIKSVPKKGAPKKATPVKKVPLKKVAITKAVTKKTVQKKTTKASSDNRVLRQTFIKQPSKKGDQSLSPFLTKQKGRLLRLKDTLLDSMQGVARDNLHAGSETSAFGMHQADAGSDAYDRDFALSILSQEQNSLYEIDEALKRIDDGSYGVCEISNKQIPRARLEARPFTRYTVECQAEIEKRQHVVGTRLPVSALFGLTEEESENEEEENLLETTKD